MSNPVFNERVFETAPIEQTGAMTVNGAINKTFLMLLLVVLSASYTWSLATQGFMDKVVMLSTVGVFAGLALAFIISFTRKSMHILAPLYALLEGLAVGGISVFFEGQFSGIVVQAVICTFAAMFAMLLLYKARIINCTEKFMSVIFTATLSVALIYLIQIVASFFGRSIPQIFTATPMGIGFSVLVVIIAAANLIMDFNFIERGAEEVLPKEYEWYGAFGLTVTLVWLYLEMLRLLSKVKSR